MIRDRYTTEPGGCECTSCGRIFIGGPDHTLCAACVPNKPRHTEGATEARTFSEATIQATRQWYADNALASIAEVRSGAVKVNDPEAYFLECRQHHADALAGKWDHTWSFRQQAQFIQTGECVPLLPLAPNQGEAA